MRKIVLLLKRSAGEDVGEFQQNLLKLAERDPEICDLASYVQSHTLLKGYAKGELLFDAVEEYAFETVDAAEAFKASEAFDLIWRRRLHKSEPTANVIMDVDVYRIKDTPVSEGAVKNIEFVNRRLGMELEPFRKYWREIHGPLGANIPTIQRYEQNHLAPELYDQSAQPKFDGLAITWFESTQAMRDGAKTEIYELVRKDEANFLPDGHLPIIIVREAETKRSET